MNLLGVHQNSASRPSLLSSSAWSIQVQHQNEVSDCPSGQSLAGLNPDEMQPGVRNAISFPEMSSNRLEVKTPLFQRASTCPILTMSTLEGCSLVKGPKGTLLCEQQHQHTRNSSGGRSTGLAAVTQQQKNRNICEWLQKVSGTEPLSESSSFISINEKTSSNTPG